MRGPRILFAVLLGLGLILFLGMKKYRSYTAEVEAEKARAEAYAIVHPPVPFMKPEYPSSGEGHATKETPVKAWLDPMKTHYRPSRPARYVFVEDTELFWDDTEGAKVESNSTEHHKVWLNMPAGKYLVYPLGVDRIYFRWWQ
jgi:hypothetical protein